MSDGRVPRDGRPTVFLDKDGTLIDDLPYNVDPRRVRFAPGAREAVRLLGGAGYRLVVATNQAGVARGYFTEAELHEVRRHLEREIRGLGATLDAFYYCPHVPAPEGVNEYALECACRKPEPGMIRRAETELGVDPARSWFVGDTWMDVLAGRRGGCRTIMVGPDAAGADALPPDRRPEFAVADLLDAARVILAEDGLVAGGGVHGAAPGATAESPRGVAPVRVEAGR